MFLSSMQGTLLFLFLYVSHISLRFLVQRKRKERHCSFLRCSTHLIRTFSSRESERNATVPFLDVQHISFALSRLEKAKGTPLFLFSDVPHISFALSRLEKAKGTPLFLS